MARGDQLGRQWKILQMLIDAKTGRSVADIADRLECHTRTLYRDLIALQVAGFPIYDEKHHGKNLWFMLESRKSISMPLSMTELTALYFGRDFLNILKDSVFHDSLKSLSSKINSAIDEKKCIDISYFAVSRQTTSQRRVTPYNIWFAGDTFYMTGLCHLRHEIRTFACDRISDIIVSDEPFTAPDDFEIDSYLQSSFGVFHGKTLSMQFYPFYLMFYILQSHDVITSSDCFPHSVQNADSHHPPRLFSSNISTGMGYRSCHTILMGLSLSWLT